MERFSSFCCLFPMASTALLICLPFARCVESRWFTRRKFSPGFVYVQVEKSIFNSENSRRCLSSQLRIARDFPCHLKLHFIFIDLPWFVLTPSRLLLQFILHVLERCQSLCINFIFSFRFLFFPSLSAWESSGVKQNQIRLFLNRKKIRNLKNGFPSISYSKFFLLSNNQPHLKLLFTKLSSSYKLHREGNESLLNRF